MRVRWIGDARSINGIGMPIAGQEYNWPDDVALSMIEQGKAEAIPSRPAPAPFKPVTTTPKPFARLSDDEE